MSLQVLSSYVQKHSYRPQSLLLNQSFDPGLVVVIPAIAEENLMTTLRSLSVCLAPSSPVEVIVVINHSIAANLSVKQLNIDCLQEILAKKDELEHPWLKINVVEAFDLPSKHAGVGLARKIGMDEAIYHFLENGRNDGLILSLDADCTCERSYLQAVENYFNRRAENWAAGIYFEHDIDNASLSLSQRNAIIQYELHLRYLVMAQRHCGFPHAYHTIGSAMTCRAGAYAKLGGMNKRQAGEDFHFLQKFIEVSRFGQIGTTMISPSSRASWRVPFGTGKSVQKYLETGTLSTYSLSSFEDLAALVRSIPSLHGSQDLDTWYGSLPVRIQMFFDQIDWSSSIQQIIDHTRSYDSFAKRFWRWINALKVVQFLHFSRRWNRDVPVQQASTQLAGILGFIGEELADDRELLQLYRRYERDSYA